ncbi:MAG: hypothetical protein KBC95_02975 [Candidatus Peribacteraceae bacterium]|nr:hypothetical protein [Candidatus Peribacteraceae bacterium]
MGYSRFVRVLMTMIVVVLFGGSTLAVNMGDNPRTGSFSCIMVGLGVVIIAALWLFAREKFTEAHRRHRKKLKAGLTLVSAESKGWYDGFDVVLTYSDGSVIKIEDEDEIPAWAKPSEVPLPK